MHNLTTALKAAAGNAGEETNPNAWDLSKGESAYESSDVWDIETLVIRDNFSVVSQEATPRAMFFKSDGTKIMRPKQLLLRSAGSDSPARSARISTPFPAKGRQRCIESLKMHFG